MILNQTNTADEVKVEFSLVCLGLFACVSTVMVFTMEIMDIVNKFSSKFNTH